jgi:hypothetical protein
MILFSMFDYLSHFPSFSDVMKKTSEAGKANDKCSVIRHRKLIKVFKLYHPLNTNVGVKSPQRLSKHKIFHFFKIKITIKVKFEQTLGSFSPVNCLLLRSVTFSGILIILLEKDRFPTESSKRYTFSRYSS